MHSIAAVPMESPDRKDLLVLKVRRGRVAD
jgi:hypothetical protein